MATAGWKGKLEYSTDSGSTWTELAEVTSGNPSTPIAELMASVFNDEGEARIHGRYDFTIDVESQLDMSDSTHQAIINAARDESEYPWRIYPDRNTTTQYFQGTCKVFDLSFDFSGGSVNTMSFQVRNSDGNKWTVNFS